MYPWPLVQMQDNTSSVILGLSSSLHTILTNNSIPYFNGVLMRYSQIRLYQVTFGHFLDSIVTSSRWESDNKQSIENSLSIYSSKQSPSSTWMLDFMGITKLVEDLGPCRQCTCPKHKAGTQVSANNGFTHVCKHTYLPVRAYLECVETEVMLDSFHRGLWDLWAQHRERPDGDKERRKERKWRKTGANKQNKL